MKSIRVNAILNTIKTVVGIVFPMITFPYISRVLQVEAVGVYRFSSSIVSYFILLAGLGVATYAVREGVKYRDNTSQMQNFVSEVFSINMLSTVISYLLLAIALVSVSKLDNYSFAIIILSGEILFTTLGVSWVCNIYEDFTFITILSISMQAVSLILTFLLVKSPADVYKYVFVVAFSKSAANIVNFFYIRKKYCKFKFTLHCNFKHHIKPILIIFSTSVAMTIYVSSDTTMLGFMTDDYQVGLYSTAVNIYTIVKNILAAALVVLVPRFSILLQNKEGKEASALFSKVFNTLMVMILPSVVGLLITSGDVIRLVGGENYLGGTDSLRLLCLAIAFSLIATLYTQCVLIPGKNEVIVFIATAVSAIVNILLNFILIPLLGIDGAAITTVIAEVIVCVISFIYGRKAVGLTGIMKNLITVICGCVGIVAIGIAGNYIFDQYIIRLLFTVACSAIGYVMILITTGNFIMKEMLNTIKHKLIRQ